MLIRIMALLLLSAVGACNAQESAKQLAPGGATGAPKLSNIVFQSLVLEKTINLAAGEREDAVTNSGVSEQAATVLQLAPAGMRNERPAMVMIVATGAGGGGTFFEVALIEQFSDGWKSTVTRIIGEGVKIESLDVTDFHVVVNLLQHAESDPPCCPTQKAQRIYQFDAEGLTLQESEREESAKSDIKNPVGTRWRWVHTQFNDNTGLSPTVGDDDQRYVLNFQDDGKLAILGDCNTLRGQYQIRDKDIEIGPLASTRMACGPQSLEADFAGQLQSVESWLIRDGFLILLLANDSGSMKFSANGAIEK